MAVLIYFTRQDPAVLPESDESARGQQGEIAFVMERLNHRQRKGLYSNRFMVYWYKSNQTDSTVLYVEVETARVPGDRIHATVTSPRREDAGQRKKRYAMGDKGKKDKDKNQKQKKIKEEQKKKKQEKQPDEIPWQRGKK